MTEIRQQINNLDEFIFRWNEKAEDCKQQGCILSAIFDEFITRYIIFNAQYKICAEIYKETGDKNSATNVMVRFLSEHNWTISQELKSYMYDLVDGIINGRFKIGIRGYSDKRLISDLQSYDTLALLRCIYQLRCNLLHGDKEFIWRQEQLLSPATHCLEILNRDIYNILNIIAHEETY